MKDTIELRPERSDDAEFVYELFASTKSDELALLGWSESAKEQFLRSQLALQMAHYHTHYSGSSFDIIQEAGKRVGRMYVERSTNLIIIHDISLIPVARGRGIGSYLLSELADEANNSDLPLRIYVEQHNPAMNLYVRLGFEPVKLEGIYYLMEILPKSTNALS